jgi:hypothetical protein
MTEVGDIVLWQGRPARVGSVEGGRVFLQDPDAEWAEGFWAPADEVDTPEVDTPEEATP